MGEKKTKTKKKPTAEYKDELREADSIGAESVWW